MFDVVAKSLGLYFQSCIGKPLLSTMKLKSVKSVKYFVIDEQSVTFFRI